MRRTDAGYRTRLGKIRICEYILSPRRPLNARVAAQPRRGALICAGDGFADVHPWPELGDLPLDKQLALLAEGRMTPLTARSLAFAEIDATFRERGCSAFDGLEIPASHFPAAAGMNVPDDFDTVKIKCGPGFDARSLEHWRGKRLRLDFNATLTAEQFARLAPQLPQSDIDFVEDPCPYDESEWLRLRAGTGIRLALDRGSPGEKVEVLVIKPAVQDVQAFLLGHSPRPELVVTSYMDHALGQMCAAWTAAKYADRLSRRCGLFTHLVFENDLFFDRVRHRGAHLLPPEGTGFGFDDLLQNLPWKALK